MTSTVCDIVVAGGGVAGLATAARLAADHLSVTVVDPNGHGAESADNRTTAFLMPAIESFRKAGVWEAMAPHATALEAMKIVDLGGTAPGHGVTRAFEAAEIGDVPFGYNIPNRVVRKALTDRIAAAENVSLIDGCMVDGLVRRRRDVHARLSNGRVLEARLAVAADGRDSRLRDEAGITVRRWHYNQRALVFAVTHEAPHRNVSTEIHTIGGPLTLVPLPDSDGKPASAVVWLMPSERAAALMEGDDATLGTEITAASSGIFGPLTVIAGDRASWPIIGQLAGRFHAERLALVGEPAHVVPPTGAQGLNMSLADAEALTRLVVRAAGLGKDIGETAVLEAFNAERFPDVAARVASVDILNRMVKIGRAHV